MRSELNVLFWKVRGVPFLGNMHQKTGMTEGLTKYAEACRKILDPNGKKARQEALKNLKAKLKDLKTKYPEQIHRKLWASYIRPVDTALPREVQDYNQVIERFAAAFKPGLSPDRFNAALTPKLSGFSI